MSNKMSVKEFDEWIDEHNDLVGEENLSDEKEKIVEDCRDKELDIEDGDLTKGMTLYNVFYIYDGVHEYEGTTNNVKKWLAVHNKQRLHEGSMLEHEDEFSFEEIDLSIYKEKS
tara:strand:+ start:115 stop:456 length:342 start_codon:yes stop_codon:yes gene_type:complete